MGGNFVTAKSTLELTAYWYSHLQTVLEILLKVVYLVYYRSTYNTVIVLRQVILSEVIYKKSMPLLCRL